MNTLISIRPQAKGGYLVESPLLPELLTGGDELGVTIRRVGDALRAVVQFRNAISEGAPVPMHDFPRMRPNSLGNQDDAARGLVTVFLGGDGGYFAKSDIFPEMLTAGKSFSELLQRVPDALDGILNFYEREKRPLPKLGLS